MTRDAGPQIVTANDLLEGDVIFLTEEGDWSRDVARAAIAATAADGERLLALGQGQSDRAVEPYLAAVEIDAAGRPAPIHYRERIRLRGPTNRTDLGRQAETRAGDQEPADVQV